MRKDTKTGAMLIGGIIVVVIVIGAMVIGPQRISRFWASYKADAYGSDWLVVKEDMYGNTIRHWELNDKSVGSEKGSDGIYFIDEGGDVVHLSGFYTYVQVKGGFEDAKKKYLRGAK